MRNANRKSQRFVMSGRSVWLRSTVWLGAALVGTSMACGPRFEPATPKGYVVLDEDDSQYDYRAVTAEGVVLAVRALDHEPQGDLGFWVKAVENRMRKHGGYALLETADIKSADGVPGKKLRFGHDEMSSPHIYYVAVFVTEPRIFVVEAGGKKELVSKQAANIDFAFANFRTRR
jgi:hypothetical protein